MGSFLTDTWFMQTFLVPTEALLISMCDNMVRMDPDSTGYNGLIVFVTTASTSEVIVQS